jgi:elongation factor Ts
MAQASEVQKLREMTGAGVMECKRALDEALGDLEKAVEIIHKHGLVKADKKAEREVNSGIIDSYIHNDRVGVLLQIHSETDFVARSDEFKKLSHSIAMQIAAMDPQTTEELFGQQYIKDESMTVEELIKSTIAKLGENIKIGRFIRYEL